MAPAKIIPLVAGNWKMNGLAAARGELTKIIAGAGALAGKADLMVCPPATLIASFASAARGSGVAIGGQDCHADASGAHTGDISAEMLADAGASAVIVGHSERRTDHHETDAAGARQGTGGVACGFDRHRLYRRATQRARSRARRSTWSAVSLPARCRTVPPPPISWSLTSRCGRSAPVSRRRRRTLPQVHAFVRKRLIERFGAEGGRIRILYGGSVKPANAKELLTVSDVNGALVGGASLKAEDFLGIAAVYR